MGRMQRQKGKRVEREVANLISTIWSCPARRTAQTCGKLGDADIVAIEGVHIEVKGRKALKTVFDFLRQAETDAVEGSIPVVVMREDGDVSPVLMLRLVTAEAFARKLIQHIDRPTIDSGEEDRMPCVPGRGPRPQRRQPNGVR